MKWFLTCFRKSCTMLCSDTWEPIANLLFNCFSTLVKTSWSSSDVNPSAPVNIHYLQQCCFNLEYTEETLLTGTLVPVTKIARVTEKCNPATCVTVIAAAPHGTCGNISQSQYHVTAVTIVAGTIDVGAWEHVQINVMAISKPLLSIAAEKDCIATWNMQTCIAISMLPHVASI